MAKHLLSEKTYKRLEEEVFELEHTRLPEVADKIGRAREMGDLSENGDYHAAKDEYGLLNDRRLRVRKPAADRVVRQGARSALPFG